MEKIEYQIDVLAVIQNIQKLKAGLAAVIGDNSETVLKAKDIYLKTIVVHEDSDEEENA